MAGSSRAVVGVLAMQGDVREHAEMLTKIGVEVVRVRTKDDLNRVQALVIPGGESTAIDKLSRHFGLFEPIKTRIAAGMPVYGTCAGLIMLANTITDGAAGQETFGGLEITVQRNAFGSQLDSFETDLDIPELGDQPIRAVFIRAPVVQSVSAGVEILAEVAGAGKKQIVAVRQGKLLGTSFHPEISGDSRFHELLVELID